jgi:hypothetical protein
MTLSSMFGAGASKLIDTTTKKGADAVSSDAGNVVLKSAASVINTSDAATFSAATSMSVADMVKSIKAAQPAWTSDNRDAFEPYVKQVLTGIKTIRGQVAVPKAVFDKAQSDLAGVQATAMVPVNGAQSVVNKVQGSLGPIADAANARLRQAQANLRTNMRGNADNAIANLNAAGSVSNDMRVSLGSLQNVDVESSLVNIEGANNTIIDAATRLNQGGGVIAGGGAASLQVFPDAGVQDIGNTIVATGGGISDDAAATLQNAAGIQQGLANIRNTHGVIQQNAASIDGDLVAAQQNIAFAADALTANPNDVAVLAHARAVASVGDDNSVNTLVSDFAGKNPGGVMGALDNATTATQNAQGKLNTLDAGVLNQDLATMDQTGSVMSQTGSKMQAGSESVRATLTGIQTDDANLQAAIESMSQTGDAMAVDANTIANQAQLINTQGVVELGNDMANVTNSVATGSNQLITTIDNARNSLMSMPSAATVKGSATELVSAFDGNTAAYQNLATALVTPNKNLADATAKYYQDIAPAQTAVGAASDSLKMVTVPLGDLVTHAKNLTDSVNTWTRMHWNSINPFDKGKVDVEAVMKRNIADILGPQGL